MTEIILPNDANTLGNLLGGRLMHFIDLTGAIAAYRHSRTHVVTAAMDHIDFIQPVHVGDLLILKSSVNRAFNTSLEVGVKVWVEDPQTGSHLHVASAYLVFVAIDETWPPPEGSRSPARNTQRSPPLSTMPCFAANTANQNQPAASRSGATQASRGSIWGFFYSWWSIGVAPVRGSTYFLCCRKESRQKKAANTANF